MRFCKRKECATARSLVDLQEGERAVVRCLIKDHGCHASKLAAMGITPGTEVAVIANSGGALRIMVRSSHLCLCRNLAMNVLVEEHDIELS